MTDLHNIAALIWIILAIISVILICISWVAITRLQRRYDCVHSFVASALGGRFLFCLVPLLLVSSVTIEHRAWKVIESQLAFWAFTCSWLTDSLTTMVALACGIVQLSQRCMDTRKTFTDSSIAAIWVCSTVLAGVVVLLHDPQGHHLGPLYCWLLPNARDQTLGIVFIFFYFVSCIYIVALASMLAIRTIILTSRRDTDDSHNVPTMNGHVVQSNGGVPPITTSSKNRKPFSDTQRISILNTLSIMTVFFNLIPQCIIVGITLLKEREIDTGPIGFLTCALVHSLGLPLCICLASRDYRRAMIGVLCRKSIKSEAPSRGSQQGTIDAIQSTVDETEGRNGLGIYSNGSHQGLHGSSEIDTTDMGQAHSNLSYDTDSYDTVSSDGSDTNSHRIPIPTVSRSVSTFQPNPRAPPRVKRSQSNQTRKEWLHSMRNTFLPSIVIQEASDSSPEHVITTQTNHNSVKPLSKRASNTSEISTESEDNMGYNDYDIDQVLEEIVEEANESTETTDSQPSPKLNRAVSEINVEEIERDASQESVLSVRSEDQTSDIPDVQYIDKQNATNVGSAAGEKGTPHPANGPNAVPESQETPRLDQTQTAPPTLPPKNNEDGKETNSLNPDPGVSIAQLQVDSTSNAVKTPRTNTPVQGADELSPQRPSRRSDSKAGSRPASRTSQKSNPDRKHQQPVSRRSSLRSSVRGSGRGSGVMSEFNKQALLSKAMARRRRVSSSSSESTMPESSNEGSLHLTEPEIPINRQASLASRGSRGRGVHASDPFNTDWTLKSIKDPFTRDVNRSSSHFHRSTFQNHSARELDLRRKPSYSERSSMRNGIPWHRHLSRTNSRDEIDQSRSSSRSSQRNYVHYPIQDAVLHRDSSHRRMKRDVGYHIHEDYSPPKNRFHSKSRKVYESPSNRYVYDGTRRGSTSPHIRHRGYDNSVDGVNTMYSDMRRQSVDSNISDTLYLRERAIAHQMAERESRDATSPRGSEQSYPEISVNPFYRNFKQPRHTSGRLQHHYSEDIPNYSYEREMNALRQERLNTFGAAPYESANNPFFYEKRGSVGSQTHAGLYPDVEIRQPYRRQETVFDSEDGVDPIIGLPDIAEHTNTNPFILSVPGDDPAIPTVTNPFLQYVAPQVHVVGGKTNPFLYPPEEQRPLDSDGDIIDSKQIHQDSAAKDKSKGARSRWRKVAMGLSIVDFLRSKSAKLSVMDDGEKVGHKRRLNPFYTPPSGDSIQSQEAAGTYQTKYQTEYI